MPTGWTPRGWNEPEGGVGKVSIPSGSAQVPRRSPSACAEIFSKKNHASLETETAGLRRELAISESQAHAVAREAAGLFFKKNIRRIPTAIAEVPRSASGRAAVGKGACVRRVARLPSDRHGSLGVRRRHAPRDRKKNAAAREAAEAKEQLAAERSTAKLQLAALEREVQQCKAMLRPGGENDERVATLVA